MVIGCIQLLQGQPMALLDYFTATHLVQNHLTCMTDNMVNRNAVFSRFQLQGLILNKIVL